MVDFLLLCLSSYLAILNPVNVVPQFAAFTQDYAPEEVKKTARTAVKVAAVTLMICMATGPYIFKLFGITVPAFRIAGGVILFKIALDMLMAKHLKNKTSPEEIEETMNKEDIGVFPVGIPLIAGPGAITTSFMLGERADSVAQYGIVLAVLLTFMVGHYFALSQANRISRALGSIGKNALMRVMGIILAAVASQFVIDGVSTVLNPKS